MDYSSLMRRFLQLLFTLFLAYEVVRSVYEYTRYQVSVVRSTRHERRGVFPSVTLCPYFNVG